MAGNYLTRSIRRLGARYGLQNDRPLVVRGCSLKRAVPERACAERRLSMNDRLGQPEMRARNVPKLERKVVLAPAIQPDRMLGRLPGQQRGQPIISAPE